jgi:hypothetical protein
VNMTRTEWVCLVGGVALLVLIVELIRKRRLKEEYALLWIAASFSILFLSMERTLLHRVAEIIGVYYPPMVLPLIAGFFGMLLAIHYSLVISRLSGENRLLAQDVALMKLELEELKTRLPGTRV